MVRLELCTGEVKVRKTKDSEPAGTSTSAPADQPKRPRGRPRKNPPVEDKPKRPRGRPRKNPL